MNAFIPICCYLATPFFWTIGAYRETIFKYQSTTGIEEGQYIKTALQPFIDGLKLNKDIKFRAVANPHDAEAYGINLFKGDALIKIEPGSFKKDKFACLAVVKHEIGHIINNDPLNIKLAGIIYSLSLAIFSIHFLPLHPIINLLIPTSTMVVSTLLNRLCEGRADDFAIANCSIEELQGFKRYFKGFKNPNHFSLSHPTVSSRLLKIETAIAKRSIPLTG